MVTVNPYCPLPIYTNDYVRMYKGQNREDTRPHIFAMADQAFRNLVEEGENQTEVEAPDPATGIVGPKAIVDQEGILIYAIYVLIYLKMRMFFVKRPERRLKRPFSLIFARIRNLTNLLVN